MAILQDESAGLVGLFAASGEDDALLIVQGFSEDEPAVLEDGGGGAENEIDGAGDGAIAVELAVALGIEGILVSIKVAVVEDGVI